MDKSTDTYEVIDVTSNIADDADQNVSVSKDKGQRKGQKDVSVSEDKDSC
jgi:hypothetical protein